MDSYSIKDIIQYREINWDHSNDFLYLTDIPNQFESFTLKPDYFCCGILTKGEMTIETDGVAHQIKQHSFFIYRPDQIVKILAIQPQSEGAFILFTEKFINFLSDDTSKAIHYSFLDKQFCSHTRLSPFGYYRLASFFEKLFDLLDNVYTERWEHAAKNLISVLLNEIDVTLTKDHAYAKRLFKGNEMMITEKFKDLVIKNFSSDRNIEFYADKLLLSSSYLYKVIKRQLNVTPSAFINTILFNEAKSLLSQHACNIGEIAEKLSFSDIHSFSKYFKKQTGMSPSKFRLHHLND